MLGGGREDSVDSASLKLLSCASLGCESSFVVSIMLSFGVYLEYPMSHQL